MQYTIEVNKEGTVRYYKPGTNLLHREEGPAVVWKEGAKEWYREGERHREDGPAYISPSGHEAWYQHGMLHREDGPAIEYADGKMIWSLDNKELSKEEFEEMKQA